MKKILAVIFAFAFPFLASGCIPGIISAGGERDAVLYGAQVQSQSISVARDIALANIPACRMVARDGADIVLSGVESFECYGGTTTTGDSETKITQRVSPVWSFLTQNSGILGMLGFSALMFPNGLNPAPAVVQPEVVTVPTQVIRPEVILAP